MKVFLLIRTLISSNSVRRTLLGISLPVIFLLTLAGCEGDSTDPEQVVPVVPAKIELSGGQNPAPVIEEKGGTSTVNFTATEDWSINISEGATGRATSWISVEPMSGKAGAAQVTITAQPNDTYDERNAVVTISSKGTSTNITVSQKQKDALLVSSDKIEVGSAGEDFIVEIKANVSVSMEIAADASAWLHHTDGTKAGTKALTTSNHSFHADANHELTPREGQIRFRGEGGMEEIVSVFQKGAAPSIVLTQTEYIVPAAGQQVKVEIESNTEFEVEMPAETWLREVKTRAQSSYTLWFEVDENPDYEPREAVVRVVNKEHGISQEIKFYQVPQYYIAVMKGEYMLDKAGGVLNFNAQSSTDLNVTVTADWIRQIEPQTRGFSSYDFSFEYDAIPEGTKSREAEIILESVYGEGSLTITVKQSERTLVDVQYELFPCYRIVSMNCFGELIYDKEIDHETYFFVILQRKEIFDDGSVDYSDAFVFNEAGGIPDKNDPLAVYSPSEKFLLLDGLFWFETEKPEVKILNHGGFSAGGYQWDYFDVDNPTWISQEANYYCIDLIDSEYFNLNSIIRKGIEYKEIFGRYRTATDTDCNMSWAILTREQQKKLLDYFGKDEVAFDEVCKLSIDELLTIFRTDKYSNPLLDLPFGWYKKNVISRSDRGITELAPKEKNPDGVWAFAPTNYTWVDVYGFAIMPDKDGNPVYIPMPKVNRKQDASATLTKAWESDCRACAVLTTKYAQTVSFGDQKNHFPSYWANDFTTDEPGAIWWRYQPEFRKEIIYNDSVMFYQPNGMFDLGNKYRIIFDGGPYVGEEYRENKKYGIHYLTDIPEIDEMLAKIGGIFKDDFYGNKDTFLHWIKPNADRSIFDGTEIGNMMNEMVDEVGDRGYMRLDTLVAINDIPGFTFSTPNWVRVSDKMAVDFRAIDGRYELDLKLPLLIYPNYGDDDRWAEIKASARVGGRVYSDAIRFTQRNLNLGGER